jgi:hypothetical protein
MFAIVLCGCVLAAGLVGADAARLRASASSNAAKPWFARSDSEKWQEMVNLTMSAYTAVEVNTNGWHTLQTISRDTFVPISMGDTPMNSPAKDVAVLYRRNDEPVCALGFAGSEDLKDWLHNVNFKTKTWCGRKKVHSGFASYMDGIKKLPGLREMVGKMGDQKLCGNGIIALGHSSGGALASLFASCANAWFKWDPRWQRLLSGVRVKEVYTFGAPEVAVGGLTNDQSHDGCFSGYRFYREDDSLHYDPFPLALRLLTQSLMIPNGGFRHPAIKAVRLDRDDTSAFHKHVYSCRSTAFPSGGAHRGFVSIEKLTSNLDLHLIGEYERMIHAVV